MAVRYDQPKGRIEDPLASAQADRRREIYAPPAEDAPWIEQMRSAVQVCEQFAAANLESEWMDSLALFNSQHPAGSKYHEDYMAARTRLFRPKTRAMVRNHEASAAQAFFANPDAVSITPSDGSNEMFVANAKVLHEVTNLRLERTIPWFKVLMGAYQTARVFGVCIARVEWQYETRVQVDYVPAVDPLTGQPIIDPETGTQLLEEVAQEIVVKDRPWIALVPPENFLIDPGADWLEPIESSPFIIERIPMYLGEVKRRMAAADPKTGRPAFRELPEGVLKGDMEQTSGQNVRQARTPRDEDRFDRGLGRDEDIVWVSRNIFRQDDGEDWEWYSIGDYALLSDPQPLRVSQQTSERPYVFGHGILEAFQLYPSSQVRLTRDLQAMLNDVTNLGLDNVKMQLAPLTKVKANADIDIDVLLNRAPYSVIEVKNMSDVDFDRPDDMGASRYAEVDRLNVDFDEIAGTFSQSSVLTNRKLNETVGGMELMAGSANAVVEFDLRTFAETFARPVLGKLVKLEQLFETDQVILATAAKQAQARGPVTADMLNTDVIVSVNVGVGATSPEKRLTQFISGLKAIGEMFGPAAQKRANFETVSDEIFGLLGYDSADRFFLAAEDQATAALQEYVKQLEARIEQDMPRHEAAIKVAQINAAADLKEAEIKAQIEALRMQFEATRALHEARAGAQANREKAQFERQKHAADMSKMLVDLVGKRMALAEKGQGKVPNLNLDQFDQMLAEAMGTGPQQPQTDPALAQALTAMVEGQQQMAAAITQLARVMAAPTEIVPGRDGQPMRARKLIGAA